MQTAPPIAITPEAPLVFPLDAKITFGFVASIVIIGMFSILWIIIVVDKIKRGEGDILETIGIGLLFPILFGVTIFARNTRKGTRLEIKSGQISRYAKDGTVKKTGAIRDITQLQEISSPLALRPIGYAIRFADKSVISVTRDVANIKDLLGAIELQSGKKFI